MMDQGQAIVRCAQCGKRFRDDCGDNFCSSSCETQWYEENKNMEDDE